MVGGPLGGVAVIPVRRRPDKKPQCGPGRTRGHRPEGRAPSPGLRIQENIRCRKGVPLALGIAEGEVTEQEREPGVLRVVFVGRISEDRGLLEMLGALAKVNEKKPARMCSVGIRYLETSKIFQ